jgi:hypothetical protein
MDFIEPVLPPLPTLDDPLFYPQSGSLVPDAVEFQFNPTLRTIESIKIESLGTHNESRELLSEGPLSVMEKGVCFRFPSEGNHVVTVSATNHMGVSLRGTVSFVVQGLGSSVKTCLPWTGGRTYLLTDPFWKPNVPGEELPDIGDFGSGALRAPEIRFGNAIWHEEWTQFALFSIEQAAPELLLERNFPRADMEKLCPGIGTSKREDQKMFWALFLASIAYPESGFNTKSRFREPPPLSKWSEGLLQLSSDDYVSHGKYCNFMKAPERILKPFENIRCAAVILKNQIVQRKTLWPGTYYYWSVLTSRKSAIVRKVFRENATRVLPMCVR